MHPSPVPAWWRGKRDAHWLTGRCVSRVGICEGEKLQIVTQNNRRTTAYVEISFNISTDEHWKIFTTVLGLTSKIFLHLISNIRTKIYLQTVYYGHLSLVKNTTGILCNLNVDINGTSLWRVWMLIHFLFLLEPRFTHSNRRTKAVLFV